VKQDQIERQHIFAPGVEVRFHQESMVVDEMLGTRKPDKAWKHIDSQGHAHAWFDDELPTVEEVVIGKEWYGEGADAYEVDVTEYRCRVCAEVVKPKYVVTHEPSYIKGPPEYTLVLRANMYDSEWRIPEEDVGPLVDILRRVFV
jgi:hypothetical protein